MHNISNEIVMMEVVKTFNFEIIPYQTGIYRHGVCFDDVKSILILRRLFSGN
jgi:hypothetical protein